ncbi:MAG: AmpD protein [Halothiobacillaceae bacterium]|nr:MAG: AmpD protein [Halothiobacillaceae bacterium]
MVVWVIDSAGWFTAAERVVSPNCDPRPPATVVDLLVIHNISLPPGQFGGRWIDALFTNGLDGSAHPFFAQLKGVKVSAHLLIRRDGALTQFVSLHQRAWHAGLSTFGERTNCNDFSIGIELEGTDEVPYTDAQYTTLVAATHAIMATYPAITPTNIVGHATIAPTRKTDPGPAFDWDRYRELITSHN